MKLLAMCIRVGTLLAVLAVLALPGSAAAASDPNSFTIHSFEADYYLTRDADRHSRLRVVEKLVVQFPPFDQNHGIERAIPQKYDGHRVNLSISSVKDAQGKTWPFKTYESNNNTVLRIGDPNKFVRNQQIYVIEYQQQDVTKAFGDHDEFYWDTNGTDWGQTFGSVQARLHMDGEIAKAYREKNRCFEGAVNATSSCKVTRTQVGEEITVTFKASRMLYAGENLTMVAAFEKGTFVGYQPSAWERLYPWIIGGWLAIGGVVLLVMTVKLWRAWQRFGRSPAGKGTIVPEYAPPKDISVLTASVILKKDGKDETAQILDLAVRRYLKIYETEAAGMWFAKGKRSYELELVRPLIGLRTEEKKLLQIIFGAKPAVGSRVSIEALKTRLYKDAATLQKDTTEANARKKGLLQDRSKERQHYYIVGGLLLAGGLLTVNPGVCIAGIVTLVVASSFHPLAEKGVAYRDQLRGLEMYMKLAEAERIRVLQSPRGASKTPVDTHDKKQLIAVYERLLPYAIIFGLEKEWAKAFAPLYDQQPDWYAGNWSSFNTAVFASSLSSFTTTSTSTFTPPSSSSSSGFGSGGSSGGGGGGGGGGSW